MIQNQTKKVIEEKEKENYHPIVYEKSQELSAIKRKDRLKQLSNVVNLNKSNDNILNINDTNYDFYLGTDEGILRDSKPSKSFISGFNLTGFKEQNTNNNNTKHFRSKTPTNLHKKSATIDPEKSIHDFLYLETEMKKTNKEKLAEEFITKNYPFKPTIPESSKKLINRNETQKQFRERLYNSKKVTEEIIVQKKNKASIATMNSFKPNVGRGPKNKQAREITVNLDGFYDKNF